MKAAEVVDGREAECDVDSPRHGESWFRLSPFHPSLSRPPFNPLQPSPALSIAGVRVEPARFPRRRLCLSETHAHEHRNARWRDRREGLNTVT